MSKRRSGVRGKVERRRNSRVPVEIAATLEVEAGPHVVTAPFDVTVENLDEGGAFVVTEQPLKEGTRCSLAFDGLVLAATIRWRNPRGVGMQFEPMGVRQTTAIQDLMRAAEPADDSIEQVG